MVVSKNAFNKQNRENVNQIKIIYYYIAFFTFLGGMAIYTFFRNIDNMILFRFINKPAFLKLLYIPIKKDSIWSNMFIYNLPYGLWCLSGLLLIRAIWLNNTIWRIIYSGIFIIIVMSYVALKLPGIIPGTFDVIDLIFMNSFALFESFIFNIFIKRRIV